MITKKTFNTHVWTRPRSNITLDQGETYTKTKAVILAISREKGIESIMFFEKSINKQKFRIFLEEIRSANPYEDVMLMMDNLSLHKSRDTRNRMDELNFHYVYTPVYSPQYNGIEEVISMGKRLIKNRRLEKILSYEGPGLTQIIMDSFNELEPHYIAKCMARSLELL